RSHMLLATLVAVVAGLSATTIGVFGGILVPGLLLLDVDPRFAAPLSLLLQVLVIPIGATSHYRLGNVKRSITVPLLIGGVIGAGGGALFASSVPGDLVARIVSFVIVAVGLIVLLSLRTGYAGGSVAREEVHPGQIGGIGLTAGFASGISGAGWGPIGVKLLILSRIEPRHAIGSSLVGRVFMALTAVITYALTAAAISGVRAEWELVVPLLAGSVAAMVPGAYVVSRIGRGRASAIVALLSIGLALPTLLWP
ncbi:MAG: sulfite exporter TauE/SafE family protein, partial [Chloroflexi bacterium]|nr:sulfite exporter TauE/SafE family protein [Chloroflexota bacterium]